MGTFSFAEEFPNYHYLRRIIGTARVRTCDQVFDDFLAHCTSRVARNDLASVTLNSYRRVIENV